MVSKINLKRYARLWILGRSDRLVHRGLNGIFTFSFIDSDPSITNSQSTPTDFGSTTYTPTSSASCCQVSRSAFTVLGCFMIAAYFLTLYWVQKLFQASNHSCGKYRNEQLHNENSIFGKRLAMKLSARDKVMPGFEVMETSLLQAPPR